MPSSLSPKKIENLGAYGLIRPAAINDNMIPSGAVTDSINFSFDTIGLPEVRPGFSSLNGTIDVNTSLGNVIGVFSAQSGTPIVVLHTGGGTSSIYTNNGSAWSLSLDGGTSNVNVRFIDFGSYTIALNFISNTYSSMRFWNAGSSRHWHYTGNPINPQQMWGYNVVVGDVYKNKVYVSEGYMTNSSRIFYSSVISLNGIITWDPTNDWVDLNPGDGQFITAIRRYADQLIVFKEDFLYRFTTTSTEADAFVQIGTKYPESVIEGNRGLYFYHENDGIYRYTGGYPVKISSPIQDIIDAIPLTSFYEFPNKFSWKDNDHIYWAVGNITVTENGLSETIKNVVLRYTESSDIWTVYSLAQTIRGASQYKRSNTSRVFFSDRNSSTFYQDSTSKSDLGEPIKFRLRTSWLDWGSPGFVKIITTMTAICDKAQLMELQYQIDDESKWTTLGQLKGMINHFQNKNIRFHRIRFRVIGITRYESARFIGIDIVEGINEGVKKEKES